MGGKTPHTFYILYRAILRTILYGYRDIFKYRKAVIRIINLKGKAYAVGIGVVKSLVIFSPSKRIIQHCE